MGELNGVRTRRSRERLYRIQKRNGRGIIRQSENRILKNGIWLFQELN